MALILYSARGMTTCWMSRTHRPSALASTLTAARRPNTSCSSAATAALFLQSWRTMRLRRPWCVSDDVWPLCCAICSSLRVASLKHGVHIDYLPQGVATIDRTRELHAMLKFHTDGDWQIKLRTPEVWSHDEHPPIVRRAFNQLSSFDNSGFRNTWSAKLYQIFETNVHQDWLHPCSTTMCAFVFSASSPQEARFSGCNSQRGYMDCDQGLSHASQVKRTRIFFQFYSFSFMQLQLV